MQSGAAFGQTAPQMGGFNPQLMVPNTNQPNFNNQTFNNQIFNNNAALAAFAAMNNAMGGGANMGQNTTTNGRPGGSGTDPSLAVNAVASVVPISNNAAGSNDSGGGRTDANPVQGNVANNPGFQMFQQIAPMFQPPQQQQQQQVNDNPAPPDQRQKQHQQRSVIPLYLDHDEHTLTAYQCFLRKQIELFEAGADELQGTAQGRNTPLHPGQVGIRCRHCAHLPKASRARGGVYYSRTIDGVYQVAQNMSKLHFLKSCTLIPESTKNHLKSLQGVSSRASGGKEYWAEGLRVLGVVEDERGFLKFQSRPNFGAGAAPSVAPDANA